MQKFEICPFGKAVCTGLRIRIEIIDSRKDQKALYGAFSIDFTARVIVKSY